MTTDEAIPRINRTRPAFCVCVYALIQDETNSAPMIQAVRYNKKLEIKLSSSNTVLLPIGKIQSRKSKSAFNMTAKRNDL